ncbi:MAG: YeeE/YedE thiosulfate transporter family protein [Burkholderiales bacterium]
MKIFISASCFFPITAQARALGKAPPGAGPVLAKITTTAGAGSPKVKPQRQGGNVELFRKTLDPVFALAVIAVLDIFLFLTIGAWTVGGGETMMTGLIAQAILGEDLLRLPFWNLVFQPHWDYWKMYISFGMFFGAFVGAVLSGEFYLRVPRRLSEWVMITLGGLLMGIGIRLAFVCNVSTFFGLTPEMNLGGYLAISGIVAGAWVGSLVYKKMLEG